MNWAAALLVCALVVGGIFRDGLDLKHRGQTRRAKAYQKCIGKYPTDISCDSCYIKIFAKPDPQVEW